MMFSSEGSFSRLVVPDSMVVSQTASAISLPKTCIFSDKSFSLPKQNCDSQARTLFSMSSLSQCEQCWHQGNCHKPDSKTYFLSMQLLGELLLDRSNTKIMIKYVSDPLNLKLMMMLLKDSSRSIQFEAFHVFKVSAVLRLNLLSSISMHRHTIDTALRLAILPV